MTVLSNRKETVVSVIYGAGAADDKKNTTTVESSGYKFRIIDRTRA